MREIQCKILQKICTTDLIFPENQVAFKQPALRVECVISDGNQILQYFLGQHSQQIVAHSVPT